MRKDAKSLCRFLENLDWSEDDSGKLYKWYLEQYANENIPVTLEETMCLWKEEHAFSPLIQDFNLKMLQEADDPTLMLLLSQILLSLKSNKDKAICRYIVSRCTKSETLSTMFFWQAMVETEKDPERFYARLVYNFQFELVTTEMGRAQREMLKRQGQLVEKLVKISGTIRQSRAPVGEKKGILREILCDEKIDLLLFSPMSLPVNPEKLVIGIVPEQCSVFHSYLNPMLLTFLCKDGSTFSCIFKSGDDLRQDAFMTQIVRVMDKILKKNGLDLNVISYNVASTGLQHGFVEFVPSDSLDNILQDKKHESKQGKGLNKILRNCNGNGSLDKEKMNTFVKSTAFYTIMTYLMCIGDRHLDNILVTNDGNLFHIDYGFVGREPKPFAPSMKLCPEMIEVMGGKHSGYYAEFLEYCMECFFILRDENERILDLVELLTNRDIPDITGETLKKMKTRFHLDIEEEEKISDILRMELEKGFEKILPKMMDQFHHTWKTTGELDAPRASRTGPP
jgi:phosphatidylinositol 3-kinase